MTIVRGESRRRKKKTKKKKKRGKKLVRWLSTTTLELKFHYLFFVIVLLYGKIMLGLPHEFCFLKDILVDERGRMFINYY